MIQCHNLSLIVARKRRRKNKKQKKVMDDRLIWNVIDLVGTRVQQYHGRERRKLNRHLVG
jgi:hypothetical protein